MQKPFASQELGAVAVLLKTVIDEIVAHHRDAGCTLTWRLLHEIESEAFQRLRDMPNLNQTYVRMLISSDLMQCERTDHPVHFGDLSTVPAVFLYIYCTFNRIGKHVNT